MRRVVGLLVIALLVGCRSRPIPKVPTTQTATGRDCVQRCQALHNDCMAGASIAVAQGAVRQTTLINGCRENLAGCYGTCPP